MENHNLELIDLNKCKCECRDCFDHDPKEYYSCKNPNKLRYPRVNPERCVKCFYAKRLACGDLRCLAVGRQTDECPLDYVIVTCDLPLCKESIEAITAEIDKRRAR